MCRMIVLAAAKKGLKTTAIALSLQTIGSIKSALIPKIYPTFYCDFLQVPHKQNDNFFVTVVEPVGNHRFNANRISYEILKFAWGLSPVEKTVG